MAPIIVTYLRRERRKWGLTQDELALLIGAKSRSQVSMLERGLTRPTAEQLIALCLLFGLTALQLFPQLAERARDDAASVAKAMIDASEPDATLRAQRKNTLLRQTLSRAVMS